MSARGRGVPPPDMRMPPGPTAPGRCSPLLDPPSGRCLVRWGSELTPQGALESGARRAWTGQGNKSGSVFPAQLQGPHCVRAPCLKGASGSGPGVARADHPPVVSIGSQPAAMAEHLMLAEGYRLVQMPPPAAPAHNPHVLRTLQPYTGPGLDSGLRPRGAPLGPPQPPPGTLAYGAFGPPSPFQPFSAVQPPAAGSAHLQPLATLYPGRATAVPGVPGGPAGLQPPPAAVAPPPPAHALGSMDAELIDEEALTSLEFELGLHRVRELPELFLGQSEFDCFSDLGSVPPAGSVSC